MCLKGGVQGISSWVSCRLGVSGFFGCPQQRLLNVTLQDIVMLKHGPGAGQQAWVLRGCFHFLTEGCFLLTSLPCLPHSMDTTVSSLKAQECQGQGGEGRGRLSPFIWGRPTGDLSEPHRQATRWQGHLSCHSINFWLFIFENLSLFLLNTFSKIIGHETMPCLSVNSILAL